MGWSHDLQSLSNTFLRLLLAACGLARSPEQGKQTPDRVPAVKPAIACKYLYGILFDKVNRI